MTTPSKVSAVIVAAGSSTRLGTDKMFVMLGSEALLARTVSVFEACPSVDEIALVMADFNLAQGQELVRTRQWRKVRHVCVGGARRQDSVLAGLCCVRDCSFVVIHDGARPLVTVDIVEEGLAAARASGAAVAGVLVKDTVKQVDSRGFVRATLERSALRAIQTPQVFSFDLVFRAYSRIGSREFTDDAAVVEAVGHPVLVYPGSYDNIKITTPEDLELAEVILRRRSADEVQRLNSESPSGDPRWSPGAHCDPP